MNTTIVQAFIDFALEEQGAPYIWQGKDRKIWTPAGLVPHKFVDADNAPISVFDCSGLVTCAIFYATGGKVDLRGSHSAKTIWDTFPEAYEQDHDDTYNEVSNAEEGRLLLYPGHVAIDLGRGIVLDANRGNEHCNTILQAHQQGAKVEVHRNRRPVSSLLGYRRIPVDINELRKV